MEKNTNNKNINYKEILQNSKKKIIINKVKNPYIVFICKLVFYLICVFSIYIIVKKLLEKYGFIIIPEEDYNNNNNSNNNNNNSLSKNLNKNICTEEIPLKLSEKEMKDFKNKNQVNKTD